MTHKLHLNYLLNPYFFVLAFYILFYLKYLVKPLGIGPWDVTPVLIFFITTHILVPLAVLIRIVTCYKNYSWQNQLNVFLASWLLTIPLIQLVVLGFGSIGHLQETVDVFLSLIPISALLSIFAGIIGLLLNSLYIFMRRLIHKRWKR